MSAFPDHVIRREAFAWLESVRVREGLGRDDALVLARSELQAGFRFQGTRIPLVCPQGIYIPAATSSDLPLTIATIVNGPYRDEFIDDHTLSYKYKGEDPATRENRGLRLAMAQRVPLIYLYGSKGQYVVTWPVFIVGEHPTHKHFLVRAETESVIDFWSSNEMVPPDFETGYGEVRREHKTREVRVRLHQQAFRTQVLRAYHSRCALCRLGHAPLLDAAHIIPDTDLLGEPRVSNGLALCKIHHAAFDKFYLGIRPEDYTVHIRKNLLEEFDGPVLQHALKALHNQQITTPRAAPLKPDRERLAQRYELFLNR